MLNNNFNLLLPFQDSDNNNFMNTLGQEVSFQKVFKYTTYKAINSHIQYHCYTLAYGPTTDFNGFIDEQTSYNWDSQCLTLFVGSGVLEPTKEDYKLSNALQLSVLNSGSYHNGNITYVERTFINTTEEAVTINEVGLYSVKTNEIPVLIGREVLKAPVILQPNESFTFGYQLTMEDLTFVEG